MAATPALWKAEMGGLRELRSGSIITTVLIRGRPESQSERVEDAVRLPLRIEEGP